MRSGGLLPRYNESVKLEGIFRIVQVKSRVKRIDALSGVLLCQDFTEKTKFEPAVHVGKDKVGFFPASFNHVIATVFKRGQFFKSVLQEQQSAQRRTALVCLKTGRNEK